MHKMDMPQIENRQTHATARWFSSAMVVAWWFVILSIASSPAPASPKEVAKKVSKKVEVAKEYKIKVAYLYSFTRYIKWPPEAFTSADSPFVIGILGDAPFGSILDRLEKTKKVQNRRIVVRHFETPEDYEPCQILFVTASVDAKSRRQIVKLTADMPVLIVGETSGFAAKGAGINFYHDVDQTIGFEINIDSLKRRHLSVDARLLKLARIVGDK